MVRKIERRALINKMRRSMVRTFVKKAEASIEAGDKKNAKEALINAESQIMRGAQKVLLTKRWHQEKFRALPKS